MKIVCTGMSGVDRRGLIQDVVDLARLRGMSLPVFDVWDYMRNIAQERGQPIFEETILDAFPPHLEERRATALERIIPLAAQSANWILLSHACFRWRDTLIRGLEPFYLGRLEPDLYITITDGALQILQRLYQEQRWRRISRISIDDVLVWRAEERFVTEGWADFQRKPHYLLGRNEPPSTLCDLICQPNYTKAYLSYPMTGVGDPAEATQELQLFRDRLRQHMVVFDPGSVNDFATGDTATNAANGSAETTIMPQPDELTARQREHLDNQIIDRDYKLVEQSDIVVVYYHRAVPSPGVDHEMPYARYRGKRVYAVWPHEAPISPFFVQDCTYPAFKTAEELFDYFERAGIINTQRPSPDAGKGGDSAALADDEVPHKHKVRTDFAGKRNPRSSPVDAQ